MKILHVNGGDIFEWSKLYLTNFWDLKTFYVDGSDQSVKKVRSNYFLNRH